MINIKQLNFSYELGQAVIKDFSYKFDTNHIYLINGENGVGKTTLIKLISGILRPTSGHIMMSDGAVISYLPDHNGIYDDLSVIDNVVFRLSLYGIKFSEKKVQFDTLLNALHLKGKETELVKNLSLGMKKKVGVICTLLVDATVYILDEPTGGIDSDSTTSVIELIQELPNLNTLVICISHEILVEESLKAIRLNLSHGGDK